ncbi:class I adenylate-forming enzyme family protein [Arthrobacter sp. GMC3]|uniref:class I adenylate-forming enzyme family protein n=1 Tax=Arthrobacter sp. GMC3 TaxID=2058894 RepID=UPI0015E2BDFE|nr:AMP-binding protein [Arthrobacter sp. GMC3]
MPFINQLQHWATARPDRAAVVVGEQSLTFAQLRERSAALASGNCTVTIIDAPAGPDLAVEFCAAIGGHGIAAVLDATWPAELRASIADQAQAWAAALPPSNGSGVADGPPESTFLLGFSSGTSGLPKAFTRSRESWRESLEQSVAYFGVTEETVTLAPGPMAASMNLYALAEAIHSGTTFVSLPSFSPDAGLASIKRDAVTRLVLVPSVLGMLAGRGLDTGQGPGALTSIVCAGSALPEAILEQARRWAPNTRIDHYYGASELGFVAATRNADSQRRVSAGAGDSAAGALWEAPSAGRAFPGAELAVMDRAGVVLRPGETGSIYVRSSYVCDGYAWGDDGHAFAAAPLSSQWFTVHDQGYLDAAGLLHLVGRAQDMVITSGNNVYPQQVEQALEGGGTGDSAEGVVVVTGIPDALRGQRLVAGLVEGSVPLDDFLRTCRQRATALPAHQRPTQYFALLALPLSAGGKISRSLLREWIAEEGTRAQRIH